VAGYRNSAQDYLVAGVLATLAGGGLWWAGERLGVVGAKPIAEALVAAMLLWFYPGRYGRPWTPVLGVVLVLCAAGLVAIWVGVFAWGNTRFLDLAKVDRAAIVVTLSTVLVTAPIYEEKVVRELLLRGLSKTLNPVLASVFVSVAFALVHDGFLWAFIFSMVLCFLALKWNFSTMQRAVVHGLVNLLISLWYVTRGYGFFA
jgi:CAAX amino terminal protease family.